MKKTLLNILLLMPVANNFSVIIPNQLITLNEKLSGKMVRNIKGMWHGITPSWMPNGSLAITAAAMSVPFVDKCFLSSHYSNRHLQALFIAAVITEAFVYSSLNWNTPECIKNRAQELINHLQQKKIFSYSIMNSDEHSVIFGDSDALNTKYPLISAAITLEEILPELIMLEKKCATAINYSNPKNAALAKELQNCLLALSGHKNIINHNLHYIKNINWQMYHAQLQLIQGDSSVEAQKISAHAQKSASRLAWLYAAGKLFGSAFRIIKKPIDVGSQIIGLGAKLLS